MANPNPQSQSAQGATTFEAAPEFAALLKKEFKPKSDRATQAIEAAVKTLSQRALKVRH